MTGELDVLEDRQQRFAIGGASFTASDEAVDAILSAAHAAKHRPMCMCLPSGVAMYVAFVGDRFMVKRMPNTGHTHAPDCSSFDPPPEVSGLGEVNGSAIQQDLVAGTTTLRLDFTLSKRGAKSGPVQSGSAADTVRTDGQKLTLRAVLHYLWEEAELTRWSPGMAGRRSWGVVQRRVTDAVSNTFAKGDPVSELLFIPEPWSSERKPDIEEDRRERLARVHQAVAGGPRLMLLVGEVKEFKEARFGSRAVIKHLPEMHLNVAPDLMTRMDRRFEQELALWRSEDQTHLLLIGTFGIDVAGYANLESASLMVTDPNWIPVDHRWDFQLVQRLIAGQRRFRKSLRYNLAAERPVANVVLTDTADSATALYVVGPKLDPVSRERLNQLIKNSELKSWVWDVASHHQPELPPTPSQRQASVDRGQ